MQDVLLPTGTKIRAGAKLVGHIEAVEHSGAGAQVSVRFDEIQFAHRSIPVNTSLRALASLMDVEDTQVPTTGLDRGTPWAWTNRNLIGGEVAYGEGGPVARGTVTVGRSLLDGAIMPAQPNPAAGCPSEPYDSGQPQAFWVFSDDACGIYGVDGVQISHAGRTSPAGVFTLSTQGAAFDVRAGSGILLRAN